MKNIVNTGVFDRNGQDTMSASGFYTALTLSLFWGLMGTAVTAYMTVKVGYTPSWWQLLLFGLAIPIGGIVIALTSENPLFSFLGYNMVLIPFGVILGPTLNQYSPDVIRNAFGLTAAITIFMGFCGTIFPRVFEGMGNALFLALGGLLIVRVAQIFIPGLDLGIIDYVAAGIFSLYIGFDMHRASQIPRTIDNAIDVSLELFLDIINLFLNILRIMGKSDD
jgi:FtsH-binding integral membrane protein